MLPDKPSLDELEHFGVKGMRWGVHRQTTVVTGPNGRPVGYGKNRPTKSDIKTARRNVTIQGRQLAKARVKYAKAVVTQDHQSQAHQNLSKTKAAFLNNPDRITALKMTKGETALHAILFATGVGTVPVVTSVVAREVQGRRIAKKQGIDARTLKKK